MLVIFVLSVLVALELTNHQNIVAESTFVCPSYWLASAYTGNSRTAYKYQYSIPFGSHGDDVSGYFGPPTENQGPDFIKAFQSTSMCISN